MGATTFTPSADAFSPKDSNEGWSVRGTITMSSSYATGGDSITAAELGLGTIKFIEIAAATGAGYVLSYNPTNGTIQAFETGAALSGPLAEVASATNLSAVSATAIAYG
jgi:hypothetical protein